MSTRNSETIRETSSSSQNSPCGLIDLPDDILYTIFSFCDRISLGRICCTCSKFNELASQDCVWIRVSAHTRPTCVEFANTRTTSRNSTSRQYSAQNRKRKLTLKERLRISRNWERKAYKSTQFIKHSTRLIPWLRLNGQDLYVSRATDIHCYKVCNDGTIKESTDKKLSCCNFDVTRFVIKGDILVSGFRGGGIIGYTTQLQERKFEYGFNECGDTQTVSVHNDIVIGGFRDGSVKVIKTNQSGDDAITNLTTQTIKRANRIWSSAIAQDGSTFAIGNAGHESNRSPLELYDLDSCKKIYSLGTGWMRGAGILDIKYETPNIMLTCGYDTSLRLWDLRTQACVKKWYEPFDAELSCLQSDDNNVIVTGTFQYGVTRLWDKRLDAPVQLYYSGQKRSPVYSLDTDFKRLFVALDIEVNLFDFSIYKL